MSHLLPQQFLPFPHSSNSKSATAQKWHARQLLLFPAIPEIWHREFRISLKIM